MVWVLEILALNECSEVGWLRGGPPNLIRLIHLKLPFIMYFSRFIITETVIIQSQKNNYCCLLSSLAYVAHWLCLQPLIECRLLNLDR